jgi:hypothetical protein
LPIVDCTARWISDLDNFILFGGRNLAPDTPTTRNYSDETAPELPTQNDWDPQHNIQSGMLGNFLRLRTVLGAFRRGQPEMVFRKSLRLMLGEQSHPRYELGVGNHEIRGRLYLLQTIPVNEPFTNDLQRFVAFVPASYSRNGNIGHYAWLHFTPVWGQQARSPRGYEVQRHYPDSIWVHKYISDYLLSHRLLASFSSAAMNAIFILPVHRFTVGNSLEPLGTLPRAHEILHQLFTTLELLEPRLRARNPANSGTIAGFGASCFSSGGEYCTHLFRRTAAQTGNFDKLRAGAFLDAVISHIDEACQWMVGREPRGWLPRYIPGTSDIPKRLVFFQQQNSLSDLRGEFLRTVNHRRLERGETYNHRAHPPSWRNTAQFHYVHTDDMGRIANEPPCPPQGNCFNHWHGNIEFLFAEYALEFCRDCFQW